MSRIRVCLRLGSYSYPSDNTTTGHVTILKAQALKSQDNRCNPLRFKCLPAVIPSSHISVSGSINALILSLTNTYSRDDFLKAGRLTFLLSFTCLAIPFSPPPCLGSGKSWEGCMNQYLLIYFQPHSSQNVFSCHSLSDLQTSCCWWSSFSAFWDTARAAENQDYEVLKGLREHIKYLVILVWQGSLCQEEQGKIGWKSKGMSLSYPQLEA